MKNWNKITLNSQQLSVFLIELRTETCSLSSLCRCFCGPIGPLDWTRLGLLQVQKMTVHVSSWSQCEGFRTCVHEENEGGLWTKCPVSPVESMFRLKCSCDKHWCGTYILNVVFYIYIYDVRLRQSADIDLKHLLFCCKIFLINLWTFFVLTTN